MFSPGPYQPSYDVMLKFYGYYKQATQGKCNDPKPSFWDVVGKAKWEAWNKCGNMSERDAMTLYIEELKQVTTANSIFNFDLKLLQGYRKMYYLYQFINDYSYSDKCASRSGKI